MYRTRLLALAATAVLAGSRDHRPAQAAATTLPAHLRFANQLGGNRTWSLASNGNKIFTDVAPNTTTAYIAVTDTVARLTLHREGSDSVFSTTNYQFAGGSWYTATATYGNSERPVLAVERGVPPKDTMP